MGATIVDGAVSPPLASRSPRRTSPCPRPRLAGPAPATVDLRVPTPGGGSVAASGQIRASRPRSISRWRLKQADLAAVAPYLPLHGARRRQGGRPLAIKGSSHAARRGGDGQRDVSDGLRRRRAAHGRYVKRLDLAGLQIDWPRRVPLDRLRVPEPWVLVERKADGSIPLLSVLGATRPWRHRRSTGAGPRAGHAASPSPHRDRRGDRRGWLRPLRRPHDVARLREEVSGLARPRAGSGPHPMRGARSRSPAGSAAARRSSSRERSGPCSARSVST